MSASTTKIKEYEAARQRTNAEVKRFQDTLIPAGDFIKKYFPHTEGGVTELFYERVGRLPTMKELEMFIHLVTVPPDPKHEPEKFKEHRRFQQRLEQFIISNDEKMKKERMTACENKTTSTPPIPPKAHTSAEQ